jgi:hypothetical protein
MPHSILFPALALIGWTLLVLLLLPYRRFRAAFARRVHIKDFTLGESPNVPVDVSLPNRNFMNLLEAPVLFYALVLMHQVTQSTDPLALTLAWVYVGLRMLHSVVHIGYNNIMHRMACFAASNLVLVVLWLRLVLKLAGGH